MSHIHAIAGCGFSMRKKLETDVLHRTIRLGMIVVCRDMAWCLSFVSLQGVDLQRGGRDVRTYSLSL